MLFMGSTARLGFWRGFVVLYRFLAGVMAAMPPLAAKHRAAG
jgi:hypothetical protein